jgi:Arc/MetJ-type ribon-helix-helix transcriptional regulator
MILKYDQTIRENTMSVNGLYNSRSELIREHAAEAASGLQKGPAK